MDLVFAAGSTLIQCASVEIIDTLTVEEDEAFTVTLTSSNLAAKLRNNVTTIFIYDIDGEWHRGLQILSTRQHTFFFVGGGKLLLHPLPLPPPPPQTNGDYLVLAVNISIPAVLSVAEDEETVQVCATLTTEFITEIDITITLTLRDGTGITASLYNYVISNSPSCSSYC